MKVSPNKFAQYRTYSHHDHDIDSIDEEFWPVMGILGSIISVWWGFIHLVDKFTFNFMPWWIEPFTIIPVFGYVVMSDVFQSFNPLHWWPLIWGYKMEMSDSKAIHFHPVAKDKILTQYGGPMNVHFVDFNTIKFRRKRDAVIFSLKA